MKNQTNRSSAVALCAVSLLALLAPAAKADWSPLNKTGIAAKQSIPVIEPIMLPIVEPIDVRILKGPKTIEPKPVPPIANPKV